MSSSSPSNSTRFQLFIAAAAAFGVYFCMYAFRKPFTAGAYEGQEIWGHGFKVVLVLSQITGYMLSKFIGIKVISEMRSDRRALAVIVLILIAEAALVGFAVLPIPLKVLMMFINGLPLGMVFGLVMGYLEGRRQTELLAAVLCASFIVSSGFVKSVGQWLIQEAGISEFSMPMVAGLIFFPPLLGFVWLLKSTPAPSVVDEQHRSQRTVMDHVERRAFVAAFWPGLVLLVLVFIMLTVIRTMRDDFAVEIWRDMGVSKTPEVFAQTETIVGICVMALNALAMWIPRNRTALRASVAMMCVSFLGVVASVLLWQAGRISPFAFMVACGIGMYVPYVGYHTTILERLIAAARRPCNYGFLMYLADSLGYLGYAVLITLKEANMTSATVLPFFLRASLVLGTVSIAALVAAMVYFERVLPDEPESLTGDSQQAASNEFAPATEPRI